VSPADRPGLTLDAPPEATDEEPDRTDPKGRRPAAAPRTDTNGSDPARRSKRQKYVARRVRRVVRRVDPWSVLKLSLIFYFCGYVVTMVAGILLWNIAQRADLIVKLQDFVEELFAYERWELEPDIILEQSLLIGAILVVVLTGLTVLAAVLFNLISDLVGGIRITVIEEDSARPVPMPGATVSRSGSPAEPDTSGL
jgi:hypothetical protein